MTFRAPHDALVTHLLAVCHPVRYNAFSTHQTVSATVREDGVGVWLELVEDAVKFCLRGVLLDIVPQVQEPLGD